MMDWLINLDRELFLFLNGLHVDWLDYVMVFISSTAGWIPFYAILLALVVWKYKKNSVWVILCIALLVTCSDQISAHVFKPIFQRPRPCHDEVIQELVYLPRGHCGGAYGFISSHACNVFAVAIFVAHVLRQYFSKIVWIMFPWATVVAYSRIYMGVHFPGDVLAGAAVGLVIGFLIGKLLDYVFKKMAASQKTCTACEKSCRSTQ